MSENSTASETLGIELSSSRLKGALLSIRHGKHTIDQLFNLDFSEIQKNPEHFVNPLYMTEEGKFFLDIINSTLTVSVLNASDSLVRQMEIKLKKEKDIDAVLAFQTEPLLPYPIENAIVDRITSGQTPDGTLLSVLAVRKDHLKQHLEQLLPLEIEPEVVCSVPSALAAFSQITVPGNSPLFVLHLGYNQTCCIFMKEGKLAAAQSGVQNIQILKQTLAKDLNLENPVDIDRAFNALDWKNISKNDTPLLHESLENYRIELTRIILALAKLTHELDVPQILLTGEGAVLEPLSHALVSHLEKEFIVPKDPDSPNISSIDLQTFAIPIGAARSALLGYSEKINFRKQEFTYPYPWKRLKQSVAIYFGMCVLLAISSYIFGLAYLGHQEDNMRREYAELLQLMNKPYQDVEREIAPQTVVSRAAARRQITPLESLSIHDIQSRLQHLEKGLQSIPDLYPLMPNVPLVSDVLAWLTSHPQVVGDPPPIQMENFSYTMVKRPEMTKKQEKYQVKVEVEFSASNPTAAREFHDALIDPNEFIDPKGDVKWSTSKGKYKAIFYLKDKTAYTSK